MRNTALITLAALGILATTTACGISLDESTFTCEVDNVCAEYKAVDAETANDLKLQCATTATDGFNCDGYSYVCYHEGVEADACTYTNDSASIAACDSSGGSDSCQL